jgi:hypothetical protein
MFKYTIVIILTSFSSLGLNARTIRMSVMEKSKKRIVGFHGIHDGTRSISLSQEKLMRNLYERAGKQGSVRLYLEAVSPQYKKLNSAIIKLLNNASRHINSIKNLKYPTPMQKSIETVISLLNSTEKKGDIHDDLFYLLADDPLSNIIYTDDRNIIYEIHNVLHILPILPLCKGTPFYESVIEDLSSLELTIDEYCSLIHNILSSVHEQAQTAQDYMKNQENISAIGNLIDLVNEIALFAQGFAKRNAKNANIFERILKHSQNEFDQITPLLKKKNGVLGHDSYIAAIWGKDLSYLISSLQGDIEIMDWFSDVYILAGILTPNAAQISFIAAGDAHFKNIHEILQRENYSLLYDSGITLNDGRKVKDHEEAFRATTPLIITSQGMQDFAVEFAKNILNLDEKNYEYSLIKTSALKKINKNRDEL